MHLIQPSQSEHHLLLLATVVGCGVTAWLTARVLLGLETRWALSYAGGQLGASGGPLLIKKEEIPKNTGDIKVAEARETFLMTWWEHLDPAEPEGDLDSDLSRYLGQKLPFFLLKPV